ncbi:hypothetical protein [Mycobacterium sp. 1274761.0]|uniref:hypothetical protein n=1 Tax=Mycobacterium sp. 1274761.0 TaxID=1834077 RepID=UPI0008013533|nr:hypothetical protein [Mycobacterium sp. 1274761.0]OBK80118.1 hypothetical protein A5651_01340 [Mycobacterium sp. 1274761.0]
MDIKKLAVTTTMAGALGLGAVGLSAGIAHADQFVPNPPSIPVPAVPQVNVPDVDFPQVNMPDIDGPDVNLPDVEFPDVEFPEVDNFFRLPIGHIPPGQLMHAREINGIANPFFGIPPGQLKKLAKVGELDNPFFEERPGHWDIPDDWQS